jgi:hypothetical protein
VPPLPFFRPIAAAGELLTRSVLSMYVHDVANLIDSFVFISSDREGATPRCRPPPLPGRRRQLGLERLRLSFVHVELQGGSGGPQGARRSTPSRLYRARDVAARRTSATARRQPTTVSALGRNRAHSVPRVSLSISG